MVFAVMGLSLYGAYRYALATNAVGLLNRGDRVLGGVTGTRVALTGGRYGPLPAQQMDVIVPDTLPGYSAAPLRPVLVFIHGGGWNSGSPADYQFIGRTFARAGYSVFLPGYRLTPTGKFPHMLEDGALALAWVRNHAREYGGDPDRVIVMGHSAGAYNAAMLALERQWLGRDGLPDNFIKAVVGLSGPYDFYPFTSDSARTAFDEEPDPARTQPITFVRGDAPPMLLLTGDADTTVKPRNTQALAAALKALGGQVEISILPGGSHEATIMKLAVPFSRDRRVLDPVLAFMAAHSRASALVQPSVR